MTTELLLIRHGRVRWRGAMSNRISGKYDPPLNEIGREQAQRLARRLTTEDRATVLYTSPLRRARETTDILVSQLDLEPQVVETLREWNYQLSTGLSDRLQLLTITWLYQVGPLRPLLRPLLTYLWRHSPALKVFMHTVVETVTGIIKVHPDQRIVIVAHGGVIEAILTHYFPGEHQWECGVIRNCSLTRLRAEPARAKLLTFNDCTHLQ